MKKIILVFLGIFLAALGVNVYNQGNANSQKKSSSGSKADAAKSVSQSSILEEIASIVAKKISPSNEKKTSDDADKKSSTSKTTSKSTDTSPSKEAPASSQPASPKQKIKKDLSLTTSLLNACPSSSYSTTAFSSSISTETVMGVKKSSLVCKNGNYQECLETCFADLICDKECPCVNDCYNTCKSFIICGQWSSSDIITQISE